MSLKRWTTGLPRRWRLRRRKRAIAASATFDACFYLGRYRDVATAGIDPLEHYSETGYLERRRPNPIFDTGWYLDHYFSGVADPPNPLIDYLHHLARDARRPNRWFDPKFYRRLAGLGAPEDPMRHYLSAGLDACDPGPDFDSANMRRSFPDLDPRTTPLGFFLNDYRVACRIDACTSYYVAGWASRHVGPRIVIAILVDGCECGRVEPWIPRTDINEALGLNALGFFFTFPVRLRDGAIVELRDEIGETVDGCAATYRIPPLGASRELYPNRASIAAAFLTGRGVEIGAFTQPTDLPPDRTIVFYDRYPKDRLLAFYDERCGRPLTEPQYAGDAQTLDGLPDTTFDFFIANHVLEHLEDPIDFLAAMTSKLTAGGRAMIAVPDMRFCADAGRVPTTFEHLIIDHELGPQRSRAAHYREAAAVEGYLDDAVDAYVASIDPDTLTIHYHVWDADGFIAFVERAIARYALPLTILYDTATIHEITVVLERSAAQL